MVFVLGFGALAEDNEYYGAYENYYCGNYHFHICYSSILLAG